MCHALERPPANRRKRLIYGGYARDALRTD